MFSKIRLTDAKEDQYLQGLTHIHAAETFSSLALLSSPNAQFLKKSYDSATLHISTILSQNFFFFIAPSFFSWIIINILNIPDLHQIH